MPDTRLKSIKVVAVDDNADGRALLKVILKLRALKQPWWVRVRKH